MPKRLLHGVLPLLCLMLALTAGTTSGAQSNPQASFDKGQRLADQTLTHPQAPDAQLLADTPPIGYVIAEGDSWFAYPGLDVLGALKGRTLPRRDYYKVYSAASPGDTVESMAYDSDQLEGFADEFRKVLDAEKQDQVKAIVLSGGGNDIAGKQFHVLLNHSRASSNSALDSAVADAFIDRIGRSLESLIGTSARYASQILGFRTCGSSSTATRLPCRTDARLESDGLFRDLGWSRASRQRGIQTPPSPSSNGTRVSRRI